MPMKYAYAAIPQEEIPRATSPRLQHLLETYASETNKVRSVWSSFTDADLEWQPHPRSSTVREILRHQLLSERRFFGEFLQVPEPEASTVLPAHEDVGSFCALMTNLARPRLAFLADRTEEWWHSNVGFFDVRRERIWVFWRRVLHTAHHRTQLTVYLRLLDRPVPSSYGPTADVTWDGADPTMTIDAASRGHSQGRLNERRSVWHRPSRQVSTGSGSDRSRRHAGSSTFVDRFAATDRSIAHESGAVSGRHGGH